MALRILKLGTENRLSVNCDGPAGRAVTSTTNRRESRCKTLQLLRIWCKKRVSDRHDGGAGRTVTGVTGRHSSPENWGGTTATVTDRRRYDGPSQAAQSQAV